MWWRLSSIFLMPTYVWGENKYRSYHRWRRKLLTIIHCPSTSNFHEYEYTSFTIWFIRTSFKRFVLLRIYTRSIATGRSMWNRCNWVYVRIHLWLRWTSLPGFENFNDSIQSYEYSWGIVRWDLRKFDASKPRSMLLRIHIRIRVHDGRLWFQF